MIWRSDRFQRKLFEVLTYRRWVESQRAQFLLNLRELLGRNLVKRLADPLDQTTRTALLFLLHGLIKAPPETTARPVVVDILSARRLSLLRQLFT